jgi:SAM-dependent methyltransferase
MNFPELYEIFIVDPADQQRIEIFLVNQLKGSFVLDLGCGTGWLAERLARRGFFVDAWDANEVMIDYARVHHTHPNVTYRCADFRTTPLLKQYDAILIINDTLNHLLDENEVTAALQKTCEHLSETGILVFDVYAPTVLNQFCEEHIEHAQHQDWTFLWSIQAQDEHLVHQLRVNHPNQGSRGYRVLERVYLEHVYERALSSMELRYQRYFDFEMKRRKGMKQVYVGHKS